MKLLSSLILLCFSLNLFAADTVRINDPANLVITGKTNATFTLVSDPPSDKLGITDATSAKVYLPIQSAVPGQINFSVLKATSGVTELFYITSLTHQVTFPLLISVGTTAKYLYLAVRGGASGTSYYVSGSSGVTYSNQANSLVNFSINPKDICKSVIVNNISTVCNSTAPVGALDPLSTTPVIYKPMLYFFLSDQALAIDGVTAIDPTHASYSGGVYVESLMSNKITDSTALVITLSSLRKGDGRLMGTFSSSTTMDATLFDRVIAYQYDETETPIVGHLAIGAASAGSVLDKEISKAQSGEFTLNGLKNGVPYKISIAFQDKFLFATTLSNSQKGNPTEIQELLKKQACYLLTAGFGEEHYIINFFRQYRDQVLANSWLGKQFIKAYYRSAPGYATIIYQHEWMRSGIRSAAFLLYFFFNYWWAVLIFSALSCLLINIRKNKLLLLNNDL